MIHGKAIIDLHNNRTHKDERIVHKNMLTNWLRDSLQSASVWDKPASGVAANSNFLMTPEQFFGGLMMFDTQLSNDADDYLFPKPSVARMIAHGNNEAYSGSDYSRGSYNAAQSSWSNGTLTRVWDFTQEQGNGSIASLGLCYSVFGKIGSGQSYAAEMNSSGLVNLYATYPRSETLIQTVTYEQTRNVAFCDVANGTIKTFAFVNGVLKITNALWQFMSEFNPMRVNVDIYSSLPPQWSYITADAKTQETVDMSSDLGNISSVSAWIDIDLKKLYILANTSQWTNGQSRKLVTYDITNKTYTVQNVTNYTGATLNYLQSPNVMLGGQFAVSNNVLYICGYNNAYVYYINLSDNTDCGRVTMIDGGDFEMTSASISNNGQFFQYGPFLICAGSIAVANLNYTSRSFILDNKKAFNINLVAPNDAASGSYQLQSGYYNNAKMLLAPTTSNQGALGYCRVPCLATKNNLEATVTKTADMTMRVTYTVTDQAE